MDIILKVFLPLSLAFIMFSLGLGLTIADFARVVKMPKAFFTGVVAQVILLPVVAFLLLHVFSLSPELALGVMILSFCPGGVTSNILTKFARGALALSITMTGIVSLLSVITVPLLVAWSAEYFQGATQTEVNITSLALALFAITAVPVLLGVLWRHFASVSAQRVEPAISRIAAILFVIIVLGALAANWDLFIENLATLGPLLIILNVVLLAVGYALARLMGLNEPETAAIAIETGVQNSTLGITVGSLIVEGAVGLPPFSLPSGVYGITMYAVTLPFVYWMRSRIRDERATVAEAA